MFASSIGRWIDHAPSRLRTLLTTVSINRAAVVIACICWAIIIDGEVQESTDPDISQSRPIVSLKAKGIIFLLILVLGISERLSRLANLLSIERDWVPTLAGSTPDYDLTYLNAVMVRIDLICKLGSPIAISALMSVTSPRLGPLLLALCNVISWPLEYWTARRVWSDSPNLRIPKEVLVKDSKTAQRSFGAAFHAVTSWLQEYWQSLQSYFTAKVWMPSLAMTCLHSSILNFSGSLTVFLIQSGFSTGMITGAEVSSAVCEFSSTYVFPWGMAPFSQKSYSPLQEEEPDVSINAYGSGALESEDSPEDTPGTGLCDAVGKLGFYSLCLVLFCAVSCHALFDMFIVCTHLVQIPTIPSLFSLSTIMTTSNQRSAYINYHDLHIAIPSRSLDQCPLCTAT